MLNISFENNSLLYQRGDRAKYRMTPMAEDLFMIEEISSVRLRFVRDGSLVEGLIALYSDGETTEYPKK